MPNYTLIHGGLKKAGRNYSTGEVVELSLEEAARLNRKGETVRLSDVLKAEKAAKEKAEKEAEKIEAAAKADAEKKKEAKS